MQDDDMYPVDGSVFSFSKEPAEQSVERKKEKAQTLEALPILQELVAVLEEKIAFYSSVDSISDVVKSKPEEFMHIYAAYKLVKDILLTEKFKIEDLIEEATSKKR